MSPLLSRIQSPVDLHKLTDEQLHQLALEDYRSVQQQAAYLLDRAIEQAIRERESVSELQELEMEHAQTD